MAGTASLCISTVTRETTAGVCAFLGPIEVKLDTKPFVFFPDLRAVFFGFRLRKPAGCREK